MCVYECYIVGDSLFIERFCHVQNAPTRSSLVLLPITGQSQRRCKEKGQEAKKERKQAKEDDEDLASEEAEKAKIKAEQQEAMKRAKKALM